MSQRVLQQKSPLSAAHKAECYQVSLFILYVQPLCLYTGICQIYTRINNPLSPFTTAEEMNFLIIWLIILISIVFLVFLVLLLEKQQTKNSGKVTEYCYIHPLHLIQVSVQSVHYSSRNGFPDYQLIILISISFQFYYWRSSEQKILEKLKSVATNTHYILS